MPNDTLREEIEPARRAALAYIAANKTDARQKNSHVRSLKNCISRLERDVEEREHSHLASIDREERGAIDQKEAELDTDPKYQRASEANKAAHQEFENLRRVNGGSYPKNVSPVLSVIPLILVGVAEWYVNYHSTRRGWIRR